MVCPTLPVAAPVRTTRAASWEVWQRPRAPAAEVVVVGCPEVVVVTAALVVVVALAFVVLVVPAWAVLAGAEEGVELATDELGTEEDRGPVAPPHAARPRPAAPSTIGRQMFTERRTPLRPPRSATGSIRRPQRGPLSCLRGLSCSRLLARVARPAATTDRVWAGSMTASTRPRSAATHGVRKASRYSSSRLARVLASWRRLRTWAAPLAPITAISALGQARQRSDPIPLESITM